ncbi:MAG: MotA/TolQ/ExbB proton channel family protein [Thiolinea sp.]
MKREAWLAFIGWLILAGLLIFGAYLLWQFGLWERLLTEDQTYLSGIILLLFILSTLYLGRAAWVMARETAASERLSTDLPASNGWAGEHLKLLHQHYFSTGESHSTEHLHARLVERVHGGHQTGWFMADLLLRLGLVGTVIGFVLMLGVVYELQEEGINALKQLLTSMGGGMQVALYTTLTGLGSATLLSIQCHWLDRCADRLVSRIIELGVHALPVQDKA